MYLPNFLKKIILDFCGLSLNFIKFDPIKIIKNGSVHAIYKNYVKSDFDISIYVDKILFYNTGIYSIEFKILTEILLEWQILIGIVVYSNNMLLAPPGCYSALSLYDKQQNSIGYEGFSGKLAKIDEKNNIIVDPKLNLNPKSIYSGYSGMPKFKKNDFIGIIVDTNKKTLQYAINNKIIDIVIKNIPNKICFAIGRWNKIIECELIRAANFNMFL